jgi:pimeloyl-ACP methyl ester carboxylesterase
MDALAFVRRPAPLGIDRLVERAGHNPHDEKPAEVMRAIRQFIATDAQAA